MLAAAVRASEAAADARREAAELARRPPGLVEALFSSAYEGVWVGAVDTTSWMGKRFNSLGESESKLEAQTARMIFEGPCLGFRV